MVNLTPTGEDTEVALLSCEFLPNAWIEAERLIVCLAAEISQAFFVLAEGIKRVYYRRGFAESMC